MTKRISGPLWPELGLYILLLMMVRFSAAGKLIFIFFLSKENLVFLYEVGIGNAFYRDYKKISIRR